MRNAAHDVLDEGRSIPSLQLVEAVGAPSDDADSWRTDPDVATMERLRDGDMEAFQVIFRKYRRMIAAFAFGFLGSRDRAEEVAQKVFMQLLAARSRYRPKARFATFLYRIATNACLNERRRFDYSGKIDSLDGIDALVVERLADSDSAGPARRLACRETATEMIKVLNRLPPNQSKALLLSRVGGFSHRQVADDLDSSIGAVRSLIWRATTTLRRDLAEIL